MVIASVVGLGGGVVYAVLALVVAGQATGLPLPGESALIGAAVLAARGHLALAWVLGAAIAGATIGGVAGYGVGRFGACLVYGREDRLPQWLRDGLAVGEAFFARHGPRAVLLARWVSGVRIVSSPLAGIHEMPARSFLVWNAIGGALWPASIGLVAFALGKRIAVLVGVLALAALIGGAVAWRRRARQARGGDAR